MKYSFLAAVLLSCNSMLVAQIPESVATISATVQSKLTGVASVQLVGSTALVQVKDGETLGQTPVGVVKCVSGNDSTVKVKASDSNRESVEVIKVANDLWVINSSGKIWVEVVVHNFNVKPVVWEEQTFVLNIGDTPEPTPDPGPTPGPEKYGLAAVVRKHAPRDAAAAVQYANMFVEAGNFLLGRPSLKSVYSSKTADNADPNKSVLAWIVKRHTEISSTSSSANKWKLWFDELNKELVESQRRQTQYLREDWVAAFAEVSQALLKVK